MLKRLGLVACTLLLCVSSKTFADPVPPSDACFTSDFTTLAKILPQRTTRPLLPPGGAIPNGEEGAVTFRGLGSPATQKDWHFRIFVAGGNSSGSSNLSELHPTMVEQGGLGAAKDAYTLHFVAPADGDPYPWDFRRKHNVIVVACDGDAVGAWAARPVIFAPPKPAQVLASFFVALIYLFAARVVYARRRAAARKQEDDDGTVYRIAKVEPWSFRRCLNPVAMTADVFDHGSLPKFQILFFVMLVAWGLAYLAIWTGALSDLSPSVVYLLGLPALGTLGSQLTTTNKDRLNADNWSWLVTRRVLPLNDPGPRHGPRWSDLVMADTELDMSKLQALTFSFIVGVSMLASGPEGFAKFEVPSTLLQILGLSQVVLVGGRFVKPTTMGDLDDLITKLRGQEAALDKAAKTGVDVDDAGKPLGPTPATLPKSPPADVDEAAKTVPTAVKRYRETAAEVQVLLEAMANRAVDSSKLMNFKLA
jgi:hypothetical protein